MSWADVPIGAWRIRAHVSPNQPDTIGLYAWLRSGHESVKVLEGNWSNAAPDLREMDFNAEYRSTFTLRRAQAQELIDSLWDSGLRPTQGHATEGAIGATRQHLSDMRALVAHYSKAKLA